MKGYLILILCLITTFCAAQKDISRKALNNFNKAQEALQRFDQTNALILLKEAVKTDPDYQLAYILLGDIYRINMSWKDAAFYYNKAVSAAPVNERSLYFYLGEAELKTGNYTASRIQLSSYLKEVGLDNEKVQKAKKYLADCLFSEEAIKNPVIFEPLNIGPGINSIYRDYFPTVTADGEIIIFTRQVNGNEDFYISNKIEGKWTTPQPLSDKINTSKFNEGAQSISPDGMYLFFTGCNRPDGLGRCDIYMSHREGNSWGEPFNLGNKVNSPYWESQPTISPDGSTLYFVSNRPGGIGSYDIWKSTLQSDGYWGTPVNLGPDINTPYDEQTPFIHPDGKTLYFSSDGWPGLGNKDIFITRLDGDGNWTKPINLGYPINTFNEETGLTVTADGNQALFSSDLKGGYGDMDIYSFQLPADKKPQPITYVKGIVKDNETGVFLDAEIRIVDLKKKTLVYNDFTSLKTGEFLAVMPVGGTYAFNVSMDGYLFYSENFKPTEQSIIEPYTVNIELSKLKIGGNVVLKNIFFETNKFDLLPESLTELLQLAELLKNNPKIAIEIQGHTDNSGNENTNELLSLNRAKAVYNYLIGNKVDAERLTFKGFGKQKPIAENSTEEGRQKNRRTSFQITKI
ncbi:MAG: hypothetical protein EOO92_12805 [Pedobacter sp.]|nr:MAG: hypothetical protein EOO92_12805 [Pedobacter sp.]